MPYYAIEYSDHLSHHGILGQKWGDRNGPPYPLTSSDKSAAEKKAKKSKYEYSDGSLTKVGKRRYHAQSKDSMSKANQAKYLSDNSTDEIEKRQLKKYAKERSRYEAGKKQYASGRSIENNAKVANVLNAAVAGTAYYVAYNYSNLGLGKKTVAAILAGVGTLTVAADVAIGSSDKKLRAYYAGTPSAPKKISNKLNSTDD